MKTQTILLLLPHLDLGGGARRIKSYCDYLDRSKFRVVIAVMSESVVRNIDEVIRRKTPRIVTSDLEQIALFAKRQKVTVLYTWYDGQFDPLLWELLSKLKKSGIKLIGNNVFSYYDEKMDYIFDLTLFQTKMMFEIKFKKSCPRDHQFPDHKYAILPNPVNSSYFHQFQISLYKRSLLRKSLGFSRKDCVVGRFGRNDIVKWGDLLFISLIKLRYHPRIKFLIIGMPRSRRFILGILQFIFPKLQKTIRVLMPTKNDKILMEYIQCVDIVGHAVKIGEGCSNAINECMFWRKPIITNSSPHCDNGQIEQVDHQENGYIAQTNGEWTSILELLAAKPTLREKWGSHARTKVLRTIESRIVVREFEELIKMVLNLPYKFTRIHVKKSDLKTFSLWYDNFIKFHKVSRDSRIVMFFRTFKRIIDYIEYRTWNG
ncbi:MAG: glycosyltransferase family 4 protein [Candidatus Pacebacteria bacterium]|nr:glycosyltransferase family 4 protein [Candidatus Paceibacterota bacterium]